VSDSTESMSTPSPIAGIDPGGNGFEDRVPGQTRPQLSPLEIAHLIWAERRLVFRWTWICLAVFTLAAFLWPKSYTATTSLMPPDFGSNTQMALALPALSDSGGSGGSVGGGSLMGLASQLLGLNTSGDLFVGVLRSQTAEDRIIDKFNLMEVYSDRYRKDAREDLESNTEIKTDRKTGIISISVEDRRPERAVEMAKAYVEELNQVLAEANTSAAHRERVFIEARLKKVKQELDSSAKEFATFASQNAAIDVPDQAKAMVAAAADLQAQLIAAQSELKGLRQIYTDNNVRVKSLGANVAELERQLGKFAGKDVDPTKDSSLAKGELYPSVRQLPLLGVKYLDLYQRSKINEAVFELLTKEYEIAKIQEAREVPSAQVLDVATIPEKKSSPHRLLIMLAGLLLGFLFSSAWVVGRVAWEQMDSDDRRKVLAQDVFSTVRMEVWDSKPVRTCRTTLRRFPLPFRNSNGQGPGGPSASPPTDL
jgi:uncharacterized protein involved in exopolysaccharide biosynthesis